MTRVGLIARADNSGLGVQSWEFARHLEPAKTLVINVGHLRNNTTHANKATYLDRFPGATVVDGWAPNPHMLARWMQGLDAVFSCECFYSDELIALARNMGVRTVLQPNWEFLPSHVRPDILAVPSLWHWDDIEGNKIHLPVPIALDRFPRTHTQNADPRGASGVNNARTFLHVVGRPAIFDRNGTPDVLASLRHVKSNIRLLLRCQDINYLQQLRIHAHVPSNVELVIDSGDVRDYWDNYADGDVLLLPRRYGGLCLPMNEALGAGMPIITTDISPNNTWLPAEWLVPARKTAEFMAFNRVEVHETHAEYLAAMIEQFCDDDFYKTAQARADELAHENSWAALLPIYRQVLSGDHAISALSQTSNI